MVTSMIGSRASDREAPLAGRLAAPLLAICMLDESLNLDLRFASSSLGTTSLELDL